VKIGQYAANVTAVNGDSITATVPSMPGGAYQAQVCAGATCSSSYALHVASGRQVPVNLTVTNVPALTPSQHIFITGNLPELGSGATAPTAALGPLLAAQTQDHSRFLLASLPACQTATIGVEIVDLSGAITRAPRTYILKVPCQGEGAASFIWG
jgi:hypothetical protein